MNTLKFKITQNEFLEYHLYSNSSSRSNVNKRLWLRLFLAISYVIFGIYLYFFSDLYLSVLFIIVGILWYFIFPSRIKKTHTNFYKKHINKNYQKRMLSETELSFENNLFYLKDSSTESKFNATEIEEIIELKTLFIIKIKNGSQLLLSKKNENNVAIAKGIFNEIGVEIQDESDWQWK